MTLEEFYHFKREVNTWLISYGETNENANVRKVCELFTAQAANLTPYQMSVLLDIAKECTEVNQQAAERMIKYYRKEIYK